MGEETMGSHWTRERGEMEKGGRWEKLPQLSHLEHLSSCSLLCLLSVTLGKCTFGGSAVPLEAMGVSSQDSSSPWTLIQSNTDRSGHHGDEGRWHWISLA